MSARRLITTAELARTLGLAPRTIQRYRRLGWLVPAEVSMGGHARWDVEDVRAQMRERRQQEQDED